MQRKRDARHRARRPRANRKKEGSGLVRPTETKGAAMAALNSFITDGLFIRHTSKTGKSDGFVDLLTDLAKDADPARRGGL
jgi:hypothetical protein